MSHHHLADVFGQHVADIIEAGRGDINRFGRHEPQCASALAQRGEVYRCELYPEHDGWAHSNHQAEAIWQ
jgi:hypothetical protein